MSHNIETPPAVRVESTDVEVPAPTMGDVVEIEPRRRVVDPLDAEELLFTKPVTLLPAQAGPDRADDEDQEEPADAGDGGDDDGFDDDADAGEDEGDDEDPSWMAQFVVPDAAPVPEWLVSSEVRKAQAEQVKVWAAWHAKYHAARLPVYAARMIGMALRGLGRGIAWTWRYATAADHAPEIRDARKAGDYRMVKTLVKDRTKTAKKRLITTGIVAGAGVVGVIVTAALAGLIAVTALGAAAITAAVLGGRTTRDGEIAPIVDTPAVPVEVELGADMLRAAMVDATMIKPTQEIRLVGPIRPDGDGWAATVDLPSGVAGEDVVGKVTKLAAALNVSAARVVLTALVEADGEDVPEGRVEIWVAKRDPYAKTYASPLVDRIEPTDMWGKVPLLRGVKGQLIEVETFEKSFLFAGEPGAGKSMTAASLLMAIGLDPHAELWLAPAKQGVDTQDWEPICARMCEPDDPESFHEMLQELRAEMDDRYALIRSRRAKKLHRSMGKPLLFLWCDELAFFIQDEDWGKKIHKALRDILARGRASGIVPVLATQKPAATVIPTDLRDLIAYRWGGRCATSQASDTILGQGMASLGYNAARIRRRHRGVGWWFAEEAAPELSRGQLVEDDEQKAVAERAYELRRAAGTLPEAPEEVATPTLDLVRAALADAGDPVGLATAEVLEYLAKVDPDTWDLSHFEGKPLRAANQLSTRLAAELAPFGTELKPEKFRPGTGAASVRGYRLEDVLAVLDEEPAAV
ncbi:FtsK/SpoIIIE domain-containing protein [Embleya hyalina]|uniref:Cell division protein FtsK n=1 Tax=Embleya hyalina TaxID=516124 RepID=A0A401Z400_9ACTN|nr:FtsK/SpoIIIE domain-containing protein [Embleya hyalina]GCE01555.1 cell division protein FtsK [Embleya hyalina]